METKKKFNPKVSRANQTKLLALLIRKCKNKRQAPIEECCMSLEELVDQSGLSEDAVNHAIDRLVQPPMKLVVQHKDAGWHYNLN